MPTTRSRSTENSSRVLERLKDDGPVCARVARGATLVRAWARGFLMMAVGM